MKKKTHRAWVMLIGCCLLQGGSLGMIHNLRGIFYAPVIADLGFGMGAFTFYMLFFGVCSCLMLPFTGKLFERVDSRVLLGAASVVFSGTVAAAALFRSLPAFYIAGALQGISGSFLMFYPAPLILGNWFQKKRGLATGISAAFAGLIGIVFNPVGSRIVEVFGWRCGELVLGILSFAMMFPAAVFLLRLRPSDCGCEPYGAGDPGPVTAVRVKGPGIPAEAALRSPAFWILILSGLFAANTCCYYAHLSPLGTYAGYGSSAAALLVSGSMAGNVISKVSLGHLRDRFGLPAAFGAGSGAAGLGFVLLLVPSYPVRLIGSVFYGFSMAMSAVMLPLAVQDIYGAKSYSRLLPYPTMAATFGTSFMTVMVGFMVDAFGTGAGYTVSLIVGLILTALMELLFLIALRRGRAMAAHYTSAPEE